MLKLAVQSLLVASVMMFSSVSFAEGSTSGKKDADGDDTFTAIMSTNFDFGETNINGEGKAPTGFFLQGRQAQSLTQMVKLRSQFKRQLRNTQSGIKAAVR